jgi:hypothetical protein
MDENLVAEIRQVLQEKPTEELRAAFVSKDYARWSREAFEAMRQILVERGELDLTREVARSVIEDENPRMHPPAVSFAKCLIWGLRGLAITTAILGFFYAMDAVEAVRRLDQFRVPDNIQHAAWRSVFSILVGTLAFVAIQVALAEILRSCLAIEHNTRPGRHPLSSASEQDEESI